MALVGPEVVVKGSDVPINRLEMHVDMKAEAVYATR